MRILFSLVGVEDPTQTHHWLWPETAEIIYGGIASVLVFAILFKVAGPMAKKAFTDRTDRIQSEIDAAAAAVASAHDEAARIRSALGNIDSERRTILAESDAQAEALLREGRARIDAEMADIEAKAKADISNAGARVGDELRAEISRLSAVAIERVVAQAMDDRVRQDLIENFITDVGAAR